jgi:hypothetical protein
MPAHTDKACQFPTSNIATTASPRQDMLPPASAQSVCACCIGVEWIACTRGLRSTEENRPPKAILTSCSCALEPGMHPFFWLVNSALHGGGSTSCTTAPHSHGWWPTLQLWVRQQAKQPLFCGTNSGSSSGDRSTVSPPLICHTASSSPGQLASLFYSMLSSYNAPDLSVTTAFWGHFTADCQIPLWSLWCFVPGAGGLRFPCGLHY